MGRDMKMERLEMEVLKGFVLAQPKKQLDFTVPPAIATLAKSSCNTSTDLSKIRILADFLYLSYISAGILGEEQRSCDEIEGGGGGAQRPIVELMSLKRV